MTEWIKDGGDADVDGGETDIYKTLDIETLQENMPYSLLNTVIFAGAGSMWDEDDIEMVA